MSRLMGGRSKYEKKDVEFVSQTILVGETIVFPYADLDDILKNVWYKIPEFNILRKVW